MPQTESFTHENHYTAAKVESKLLTIDDAKKLTAKETLQLYRKHINPNLGKMLDMLGFARSTPVRAKDTKLYLRDGTEILDMSGHLGVMNVGHNHPRVLKARQEWANKEQLEFWKFHPSPYQAILCHNLAQLFPEDLEVVFFCNSGAEANEGAMKMAEKYADVGRDLIVYTDISFHGKTHATLSVSGSEKFQNKHFKLLPGCIEIPYGDSDALEKIILDNKGILGKTKVCAFIVEAVRTEGVVIPPRRYFEQVRKICNKYDVVLIMDEVYSGFGRTGKMFAFEHHNIAPDICSFSKAFGGGKATFAAFITRPQIFNKAYGKISEAALHSSTYNGYGEEIVSAIEAINILHDEGLVENSARMGKYFLERLREIQTRHSIVKYVNGIGLLLCIRFENAAYKAAKLIPGVPEELFAKLTTGGIITELYEKYRILIQTPPHDANQLLISPPLTISKEEIDHFIQALDEVLKMNIVDVALKYIKRYLS
ncbi:MAG: aspartate aminotransferase family protein [Firmicutes bacterium]|nr:aspartate aminotransferase family protein [Bacillota bacterium]